MLNLAPTDREKLSASINPLIDAALQAENAKQERRNYLGGSRLGEECMRRLWFEHNAPDKAAPFPGRILRRFRLGHMHEDETAQWLRLAGFDLHTRDFAGEQMGFRLEDAPIGGHVDGVIHAGPASLPYPLLWEHKIMNASSWAKFDKDGVAVSHPVYHAQCVVYSDRLGLGHTLFTALNSNTSELRFELVANDAGKARALIEKGKRITSSRTEQDVPRVATVETDFRCRMCSFAAHCWRAEAAPVAPKMPSVLPSWVKR